MTAGEMCDKLKRRDTQLLRKGTKKELINLIEHLNGSHLAGWSQCWAYLLNLEALKAGNMRDFPFKKFPQFPPEIRQAIWDLSLPESQTMTVSSVQTEP
jgi:hypothetical protein